jgi:hypothetical protein
MKDDIFQKKNQDFIIAQPLNEMFSCCSSNANNKNKNINVKLKNQNGGLIQDGDENIFYFPHNKPQF